MVDKIITISITIFICIIGLLSTYISILVIKSIVISENPIGSILLSYFAAIIFLPITIIFWWKVISRLKIKQKKK